MSKIYKKKPMQLSLKQKSRLAPQLFAIFALLIILALTLSVLMPQGVIR